MAKLALLCRVASNTLIVITLGISLAIEVTIIPGIFKLIIVSHFIRWTPRIRVDKYATIVVREYSFLLHLQLAG